MRTYASMGRQWLLRICVFLLTIVLVAGSMSLVLLAWMDGYSFTREECWQTLATRITENKMTNLMHEWYLVEEYGKRPEQMSADFRGKGHLRYMIQSGLSKAIEHSTLPSYNVVHTEEVDLSTKITLYIYVANGGQMYYDIKELAQYYNNWYASPVINHSEDTIYYTMTGYYAYESEILDEYDLVHAFLDVVHPLRYVLPWALLAILVLLFVLVIRLTTHTGHRQYLPDHPRYRGEVVESFFDRIPYDLYICILGGLFLMCCLPLDLFQMQMLYLGIWLIIGLSCAMLLLVTAAYLTTVTRIKARTLFSNTLVWKSVNLCWRLWLWGWGYAKKLLLWAWGILCRIFGWCWRVVQKPFHWMGRIFAAIPLFWQVAVTAPVVIALYSLLASVMWSSVGIFLLCGFVALVLYLAILYAAYSFRTLMESGKALAEGDLRYKTNLKQLMLCFRSHGENLNKIGEGMEIAVADKIKSERFKTELITNVSHDIKTPLTSIINYTDLLSREPLEGNAKEYTEVLSRQSTRLKKLIEDLIEASKASTGNVTLAPEKLDVCQIVRQSLGEYMERLERANLQVVQLLPEEPCYALVDGRQMWRVFDNLYSNICKYAMPGTRVYVVVTAEPDSVTVSMKNISRDVLTTASEELTERFVQGDVSRASEGSGLGLNIAKSLTELQKGTFRIHCDGDLFRVDISLSRVDVSLPRIL